MPIDTAILGGTLLTLRGDRLGIVDGGAVGIDDGRIVHVGSPNACPSANDTIDAGGCVVMPGLVDAHAHLSHTLLRGAAQDVPEIEWMTQTLGPFTTAATDRDRQAGARLGLLEAVRGGVTTVCEYAECVGDLVEAVHSPARVRTVAVEMINEVPADRSDSDPDDPYDFDPPEGREGLQRADALFDRFADEPLVIPAYGPQAIDMVSLELLDETYNHAADRGARVHVHVAQGDRERRQIQARYGADATTVSTLEANGLLHERLVAVHCHGTTPEERHRLIQEKVPLVGCPSSIAAIDGRVAPVADYRSRGGTVGLGTDQAPGPGHHSMLREARTASTLSKVTAEDPTRLPAWQTLRLATVGGAETLGIDHEVGRLKVGHKADVIVIDMQRLSTAPVTSNPLHTAVPNLVYSTTGREVRDVLVDGEPLIRDESFVHSDPNSAVTAATRRAQELYDRASTDWRKAGSTLVDRVDEGWL